MRNAARPTHAGDVSAVRERVGNYIGVAWVLSKKNFQVRYKRAVIGVLWAVLQPAFQAMFLSFVFIKILRIATVDHFPVFVLSGMLPWAFFASSVQVAMTAVVDNGALVRKVAIPLSVFPVSAVGGASIAFAASLTVLVGVTIAYGTIGLGILLLPLAVGIEVGLIVGAALLTGAFHVAFRDIKYAVESTLIVGFYGSPILYPLERVPAGALRDLVRANPMTGVLSLTRGAALGRDVDWRAVTASVATTLILLVAGAAVFRRRSGEFADLV